jgi:DNA modification methylase
LIDGFHRWKAHQLNGETEIIVEVVNTPSEKELKRLAYQWNSNHGLQLDDKEKKKYAQEMIGDLSVKELALILSVGESTIKRWTESQRKALEEDRNRKIVEMYLRAWNTQEAIADVVGLSQRQVSEIIDRSIDQWGEISKDFTPPLYNIWNLQKQDAAVDSHFGSFPLYFMQSFLHYHTEPLDIVFDPFAGGGTTVDACIKMFRRYYCTDMKVTPGREKDILEHDILNGFPKDMPKPAMMFLDPPYWTLAKKEYSEGKNDLGNMTKEQFYESMKKIAVEATGRNIEKIAYLIRPIWETGQEDGWNWVDPLFDMHDIVHDAYEIEARYTIPYSTQQYSGRWVERAKKENKCLILNRELAVWKRRQ